MPTDDPSHMAMPQPNDPSAESESVKLKVESVSPPQTGTFALVGLFSATLFLSALLLFSIQPIFARMLLPLLGGAPAVWNTAMLFYQAALLGGYAYAHWAGNRLSPKTHLISHIVLLGLPLVFLPFGIPAGSAPSGGANPVPWLLLTMLVSIGMPFFVVSSTGPLLQRWFSRTGHPAATDPYFLYAASNLGSMLGLLGYPFLIEPNLRLAEQSRYWAFGYIALAVAIIACASRLRHSTWLKGQFEETQIVDDSETAPTAKRRWKWIALAFVPSSLMLGVTQYISTDVAAVPLLWVVPLTLYLLTFTIVFARRPIIPHRLTLLLMPVAVGGMVVLMTLNITKPLLVAVAVHLAAFFFVAMMCHGEMAKDRPSVRYLTEFYLLMSVGGVLGGLFNAIVAPLLFPLVLEYHLVLVAAAFLYPGAWSAKSAIQRAWDFAAPVLVIALMLAAIALERKYGLTSSKDARQMIVLAGTMGCLLFVSRPLRFGLSLFAMLAFGLYSWAELRDILYVERSFFGVTRIESSNAGRFTDIFHGTTLHGMQSTEPENRMKPVSYYFPSGPIGVVLTHMERPVGADMAVIGLGSGTLATYGRPSEKWTYFEIDPVVEKVARDPRFFTYLRDSQAEVKVVLGDARMSLRDSTDQYDCIMLDAYSSDAVPIHLITKEALALYMKHLKPKGILMFHISNKHLDLEPVVHELARDAGLNAMGWRDTSITPEERSQRKVGSDWIMVYRSGANVSRILELGDWKPTKAHPGVGLWTDDFSSIWTIYNTQRIGG